MSNNLTSSVTLDLQLQIEKGDKSKDAIRALEKELKEINDIAKKGINAENVTGNLKEVEQSIGKMTKNLQTMLNDTSLDLNAVVKSYSRDSGKIIDALDAQYAYLREKQSDTGKKLAELRASYEEAQNWHEEQLNRGLHGIGSNQEIEKLQKAIQKAQEVKKIEDELIALNIRKNQELRAQLKSSQIYAKTELATSKLKAREEKRSASFNASENKALTMQTRHQQAFVNAIKQATKAQEVCLKQQNAITAAIQNSEKAETKLEAIRKKASRALQNTYNAAGLVGGAGRMLSGGIHAASSGMAMISDASNKALERERAAGRVKGVDADTASKLIGDVYVKTGADTDKIVDAINRVRGLLGNLDNSELAQAASLELRYPGMSMALASVNDPVKKDDMLVYANKMKAIQAATGASDEQLAASTQAFANRKDIVKAGGSVSDYQAVYLAMQNSGAFDTDEELERVFQQFVRKQRASKKSVFEFAKDFKMEKYARGERNKLQAKNADANMKWDDLATAASTNSTSTPAQTTAEKNAERIRNLEERKNQMMIKLIDIVEPIVNELNKVLDSDKIKRLVDGLVKFITDVMPILANVILKIAEKLGMAIDAVEAAVRQNEIQTQRQVDAAKSRSTSAMLASRSGFDRAGQFANGGIAWGTSIVGERGPEAIIPLDYSRTARAGNIVQNVAQTFNMSGNETTALSLAQAVSSRDFTRAMGKAAFKAGRLGAF